jgi:GNAT superfamily N-acetyltransferase
MAGPSIEIRSATEDEAPETVAAIVAAFIADPVARFALPSPNAYLRGMPPTVRAFGGRSFERSTAFVSSDFRGAALWLPPGVHPDDEVLDKVFRDIAAPDHLDDLLATFEKMDEWHPDEPHWYLALIGVDANARGRGLGGALMRHAAVRCDQEDALAYLESSNPRNISLYERHGFEVMGEIQVGSAPPVTPMLRRPR